MQRILVILTIWLVIGIAPAIADETPVVQVYKTPTCECCNKWVEHLRANGFEVKTTELLELRTLKMEKGIPRQLHACHTAIVGSYIVEGHVPASDIKRLLETRPAISGIAVPGMPIGSPGMEGADPETYDVVSFGAEGMMVFATHGPGAKPAEKRRSLR